MFAESGDGYENARSLEQQLTFDNLELSNT